MGVKSDLMTAEAIRDYLIEVDPAELKVTREELDKVIAYIDSKLKEAAEIPCKATNQDK
jgi:hypothetical protein